MATGKAAVFYGPGKPFEIREVPVPDVEPDAVLIKVSLANICGSDLHFWRGDAPLKISDDGWIYGHEMMGRVAKLGSNVKTDSLGRPLREGDRVAYSYFVSCGRCPACQVVDAHPASASGAAASAAQGARVDASPRHSAAPSVSTASRSPLLYS